MLWVSYPTSAILCCMSALLILFASYFIDSIFVSAFHDAVFTPFTFTEDSILSISKNSAFLGLKLKGKAYGIINNNQLILAE